MKRLVEYAGVGVAVVCGVMVVLLAQDITEPYTVDNSLTSVSQPDTALLDVWYGLRLNRSDDNAARARIRAKNAAGEFVLLQDIQVVATNGLGETVTTTTQLVSWIEGSLTRTELVTEMELKGSTNGLLDLKRVEQAAISGLEKKFLKQ